MCGVIGLITPRQKYWPAMVNFAAMEVFKGLLSIQHRGQDGAGLASFDFSRERFSCHKNSGLVTAAIDKSELSEMLGEMALGHTRYPTAGCFKKSDLQPQITGFPIGLAMAHNGNIVNHVSMSKKLKADHQIQFLSENDIESFMHHWSLTWANQTRDGLELKEKLKGCSRQIFQDFVGGYALVGMLASQGVFGMRDPSGIRPLVLGKKVLGLGSEGQELYSYCLASETTVLQLLDYEFCRDIEPGEFIYISPEVCEGSDEILSLHFKSEQEEDLPRKSVCMFEWVYFSAAESALEGRSIYESRLGLGEELAKEIVREFPEVLKEVDVVCPVPDTSRTSAISLAESLGLPYREALIKNRYIQRSFILADQQQREKALSMKLSPVVSEIKGKRILLVDDSLVRGSTSRKIIKLLKEKGAKEVFLALTCPPLKHPCFYGIDFPDTSELAASNRSNDEIAKWIGAARVFFISSKGLEEAIGLKGELCSACVSGKYPTVTDDFEGFSRGRKEVREQHYNQKLS